VIGFGGADVDAMLASPASRNRLSRYRSAGPVVEVEAACGVECFLGGAGSPLGRRLSWSSSWLARTDEPTSLGLDKMLGS
jgi:hypothetical protein